MRTESAARASNLNFSPFQIQSNDTFFSNSGLGDDAMIDVATRGESGVVIIDDVSEFSAWGSDAGSSIFALSTLSGIVALALSSSSSSCLDVISTFDGTTSSSTVIFLEDSSLLIIVLEESSLLIIALEASSLVIIGDREEGDSSSILSEESPLEIFKDEEEEADEDEEREEDEEEGDDDDDEDGKDGEDDDDEGGSDIVEKRREIPRPIIRGEDKILVSSSEGVGSTMSPSILRADLENPNRV